MRIFVSSSFDDLKEHRAAAIRVLILLCHKMVEFKLLAAGTPDEVARQCACDDDAYGCD